MCASPERDSHLPRARLLLRNEPAPRQSSQNPTPTRAKGPFARTPLGRGSLHPRWSSSWAWWLRPDHVDLGEDLSCFFRLGGDESFEELHYFFAGGLVWE